MKSFTATVGNSKRFITPRKTGVRTAPTGTIAHNQRDHGVASWYDTTGEVIFLAVSKNHDGNTNTVFQL